MVEDEELKIVFDEEDNDSKTNDKKADDIVKGAQKKTNKSSFWKLRPVKYIRRTLTVILVTVLLLVLGIYGVAWILINGPSNAAKNQFVCALKETSAMGWVANLYLSEDSINEILESGKMEEVPDGTISDTSLVVIPDEDSKDKDDTKDIELIDITGTTYRGKLLIIKDPSRIFVGTVDEFKESTGLVVREICKKYNAIAGINGGEFFDKGSYAYSALPVGGVISQGKHVFGDLNTMYNITGFTKENKLVIGKMTVQQALDVGVRDCVHTNHETGPFLVIDGEPLTVPDSSSYGGGKNPRTAIGQRADGAVLLLVVDGRQANSIGATFKELAYIMLEYGAINASAMDGGTSTQMVYNDEVVNHPYLPQGPRRCPTAFIVK